LPLQDLHLPQINTLTLTAPNGKAFTTKLPLGGFGISRYTVDHLMAVVAKRHGVYLQDDTKVNDIVFDGNRFVIGFSSRTGTGTNEVEAKLCLGAFGKRSNIDVKWRRNFITKTSGRENNYVAVKYHIQTSWPEHVIGLHNFSGGYCGISKIEEDKYCLCYLTTAVNLKKANNSVSVMEETILFNNPALKKIFTNSQFLQGFPVTIAQVSFSKKELVENGVLMIGDAAGMIAPLCGNGMSMALHASKMAARCADDFLSGRYHRAQMEETYKTQWNREFKNRLKTGRILQGFFGADVFGNLFVSAFRSFPFLAGGIIKKTHGKPF
jgi:flavin-dependent dehydrogenase